MISVSAITPSEISRILPMIRKPNSIIDYHSFKIIASLKPSMLSLSLILPVYQQVEEIKGCSGVQILSK